VGSNPTLSANLTAGTVAPVLILLGFAAMFATLTALRFNREESSANDPLSSSV
jgi:hypothetical protein